MEHSCICHGHPGTGGVTEAGAHVADGAGGGAAALQGAPRGCSIRPYLPVRQVYSCCARRRKRGSIRRPHSICMADAVKTALSHSCAASEHAAREFPCPLLLRRIDRPPAASQWRAFRGGGARADELRHESRPPRAGSPPRRHSPRPPDGSLPPPAEQRLPRWRRHAPSSSTRPRRPRCAFAPRPPPGWPPAVVARGGRRHS